MIKGFTIINNIIYDSEWMADISRDFFYKLKIEDEKEANDNEDIVR